MVDAPFTEICFPESLDKLWHELTLPRVELARASDGEMWLERAIFPNIAEWFQHAIERCLEFLQWFNFTAQPGPDHARLVRARKTTDSRTAHGKRLEPSARFANRRAEVAAPRVINISQKLCRQVQLITPPNRRCWQIFFQLRTQVRQSLHDFVTRMNGNERAHVPKVYSNWLPGRRIQPCRPDVICCFANDDAVAGNKHPISSNIGRARADTPPRVTPIVVDRG